jgi:hypothetical protein
MYIQKIKIAKDFGKVFSIIFLLISVYLFYKESYFFSKIFFSTSIIFFIIFLVRPIMFFSIAIIWRNFGYLIGGFITPIILRLFYFVIFAPFSLIVKIFHRDILDLKTKNKKTFWKKRKNNINTMNKQF